MPTHQPTLDVLIDRVQNLIETTKEIDRKVDLIVDSHHQLDRRLLLVEQSQEQTNNRTGKVFDALWKLCVTLVSAYILWRMGWFLPV